MSPRMMHQRVETGVLEIFLSFEASKLLVFADAKPQTVFCAQGWVRKDEERIIYKILRTKCQ